MTLRVDADGIAIRRIAPSGAALELRRPTAADRRARMRLLMERFDETAEEIEERLASYEDGESLIALDRDVVVGTLRLIPAPGRWMMYGFVIDRERRGQGLGSRMLATVLERLRSEGVAEVGLEVDPENTPAVRLYERFGFETVTTYRYMRLIDRLNVRPSARPGHDPDGSAVPAAGGAPRRRWVAAADRDPLQTPPEAGAGRARAACSPHLCASPSDGWR